MGTTAKTTTTESHIPPEYTPGIIQNPLTGLCLAVDSNAQVPADYTNVHVDRCGHLSVAELWRFIVDGGIQHNASGKCLDEDTDHDDDGRNDHEVELYSCHGVQWQKWNFVGGKIINRDNNLRNQEWVFVPRP